ncbi:MAG: hypothetical protein K2Q15_00035, partial [Burkholderiales bacterium]|nr:hypothetical protein [Burkholderiales bacterium]
IISVKMVCLQKTKPTDKHEHLLDTIIKIETDKIETKEKKYNNLLGRITDMERLRMIGSPKVKSSLRDQIANSFVVKDSNTSASESFKNSTRFNFLSKNASEASSNEFLINKELVKQGSIQPLVGCGIIAPSMDGIKAIPIQFDYIRHDQDISMPSSQPFSLASQEVKGLINTFDGAHMQAAELIPGTPLGNYFNQHQFGQELKILNMDNGQNGSVGIRINLSELPENTPLLISSGVLSGGTFIQAVKGDYLYAYNASTSKNNSSTWTTSIDGARSIIESHQKYGDTPKLEPANHVNNQTLVDFLSATCDFAVMTYCGHENKSDSMISQAAANISTFDYNASAKVDNHVQVGNAMALLIKQDGKIKIETLSDDMRINLSSRNIASANHQVSQYSLPAAVAS